MFWCEGVIDRDYDALSVMCYVVAYSVVAIEATESPAAAVCIDEYGEWFVLL